MTDKSMAKGVVNLISRYGMAIRPFRPLPDDKAFVRMDPETGRYGAYSFTSAAEAAAFYLQNPDARAAVMLGESGMCSLDIDEKGTFETIFKGLGLWDALQQELKGAPHIEGTVGKGGRYLFRVPEGKEYSLYKYQTRVPGSGKAASCIFELRAACMRNGKMPQICDQVPPSEHKSGKPYTWLTELSIHGIPYAPPTLQMLWEMDPHDLTLAIDAVLGVETKSVRMPKAAKAAKAVSASGEDYDFSRSISHRFCIENDLVELLLEYGYIQNHYNSNEFQSPNSSADSGTHYGITILDRGDQPYDKAVCWHASEPHLVIDRAGGYRPFNAFDLYCAVEHDGDVEAAKEALKAEMAPLPRTPHTFRDIPSIDLTKETTPKEQEMPEATATEQEVTEDDAVPFECLGPAQDDGGYYFRLANGSIIVRRSRDISTKGGLIELAPLEYWENLYGNPDRPGAWNHAAAHSDIISTSKAKDMVDLSTSRGLGVYLEGKSVVCHQGNSLLVDGTELPIASVKSKNLYVRKATLEDLSNIDPLTTGELEELRYIYNKPNFATPLEKAQFLGWIPTATICGALPWRPSVWLSAARGTGKSTLLNKMVRPLLGPVGLSAESSTGAGVRQALGYDARPVTCDEVEACDKNTEGLTDLVLNAATGEAAGTYRGTSGGKAVSYSLKSSFMFASVGVPDLPATKASRISVVELMAPTKESKFTSQEMARIKELAPAFRRYVLDNTKVLLAAIPVIRDAILTKVDDERIADQQATLLAGYWLVNRTSEVITERIALELIEGMDFKAIKGAEEEVSSDALVFSSVLSISISYQNRAGETVRSSVADAWGDILARNLDSSAINNELGLIGLKVTKAGTLFVCGTHPGLLAKLPPAQANGVNSVLKRSPLNANGSNGQCRHSVAGQQLRGVEFNKPAVAAE